jgi:hypothetical protein
MTMAKPKILKVGKVIRRKGDKYPIITGWEFDLCDADEGYTTEELEEIARPKWQKIAKSILFWIHLPSLLLLFYIWEIDRWLKAGTISHSAYAICFGLLIVTVCITDAIRENK